MPEVVENATGGVKKVGGKLKATLTKKLGPLPVWGWSLIGVGMFGLFYYMKKHRGGGSATQGGALTVAAPESAAGGGFSGGGSGGGGGGSDLGGGSASPSLVTIPSKETVRPLTPMQSSIDNQTPSTKLPASAAIIAPTPEEIAFAINKRDVSTGAEQAQWNTVTQEHTQRLAASLNQTPQGQQQLANVTRAYAANPTAAQTFFEQAAKNPAGVKAMFGGSGAVTSSTPVGTGTGVVSGNTRYSSSDPTATVGSIQAAMR